MVDATVSDQLCKEKLSIENDIGLNKVNKEFLNTESKIN